jgi:BirA family biotin operon repressor/biotin-[acetyl-CoA-carboxylase] ligase
MREEVYAFLLGHMREFVSGEAISREFGISRAAVLKHVQAIRNDGAKIESVTNKGHMLEEYADRLKQEYIAPLIPDCPFVFNWHDSLDSTNAHAKALAVAGEGEFLCVTAEEQTGGRGRMGRVWVSPKYKNIYFTIILRPDIPPEKAPGITVLLSVAVCNALRDIGLPAAIKWPNDVLVGGKKICGILTESAVNMDCVEYAVSGVGINVNADEADFAEIRDIATSVKIEKGVSYPRTKLLSDVLSLFYGFYRVFVKEGLKPLMPRYSEYSALHGKRLTLVKPGGEEKGLFAGFDDDAALLLETDAGIKRFVAGEISLKGF